MTFFPEQNYTKCQIFRVYRINLLGSIFFGDFLNYQSCFQVKKKTTNTFSLKTVWNVFQKIYFCSINLRNGVPAW